MFDTYVSARDNRPRRKWVTITLSMSAAFYFVLGLVLVIYSFWNVERLPAKYVPITFAAGAAPPPPPPPPPPKKRSSTSTVKKPKPVASAELVQPVKTEDKPVADTGTDEGSDDGVEGGVEGGVVGGVVGGVIGGTLDTVPGPATPPPPPPPPPPEEKPTVVPISVVEAGRVSGNPDIQPPASVTREMRDKGQQKLIVAVKLCLNSQGTPTSVQFARRSGFPEYDDLIESEMLKWRYRPTMVNGKAVAVCTAVTFNIVRE
jgi:periplasmic protein TonB